MSHKDSIKETSYWNDFYSKMDFEMPSQFCALLASEIGTDTAIIEFGCGNGRDSLFLARHGYIINAIDLSVKAIEKCNNKSKNITNITFTQGDVSSEEDIRTSITTIKDKHADKSIVVYSRFFLHSIDDKQEHDFLTYLSKYLNPGDTLYLEFRSKEDEGINKIYDSHYRRYINSGDFITSLTGLHGFQVSYFITGQGMAKYKSEDPFVTRIIATKK